MKKGSTRKWQTYQSPANRLRTFDRRIPNSLSRGIPDIADIRRLGGGTGGIDAYLSIVRRLPLSRLTDGSAESTRKNYRVAANGSATSTFGKNRARPPSIVTLENSLSLSLSLSLLLRSLRCTLIEYRVYTRYVDFSRVFFFFFFL